MKYSLLFIVTIMICMVNLQAQDTLDFEQQYLQKYEINIKKSVINGVYIPQNLEDCFKELERLSQSASIREFMDAPEDQISRRLHFGLGRWISTKWNFYEGSRFSHYLKSMGITHPDDMVQFTIVSFHRYLNGRELAIKDRANQYEEKRKNEQLARVANAKVLERDTIKKNRK